MFKGKSFGKMFQISCHFSVRSCRQADIFYLKERNFCISSALKL